jgi:starch phosphorylase
MKVLVNGGLNVSSLDGWWAEAYAPDVGWAIGAPDVPEGVSRDAAEALQLYGLLEREIVPTFYARDERGIPVQWLARVRASMAALAPRFSANRMLREYLETLYLPSAALLRRRASDDGRVARELAAWHDRLTATWRTIQLGPVDARRDGDDVVVDVVVRFGAVSPGDVRVEVYAEPPTPGDDAVRVEMTPVGDLHGGDGVLHRARIPTPRPPGDFTPRVIPFHAAARVPTEVPAIVWAR